jgi:hypothetical protein
MARPWSSNLDWLPGGAFELHVREECRRDCTLAFGPRGACTEGLAATATDHAKRPPPQWRSNSKAEPAKR